MKRKAHEVSPLKETDELDIGEYYIVKRYNGTLEERFLANLVEVREVPASLLLKNREMNAMRWADRRKRENDIERRRSENAKQPLPPAPTEFNKEPSEEPLQPDGIYKLYYVHYDGKDRRLDEWVERNRFVERALPPEMCSPAILPSGVENAPSGGGTITRSQKRIHVEFHHQQTSYDDMDATTAQLEKEHEERTKVKNVMMVVINDIEIFAWYFSPYPAMDASLFTVYVCDYCLMYTGVKEEMQKHRKKCEYFCPPGQEIYRHDDSLSIYEVVGKVNKTYCQSLCLLSKLFLDHKTLYFDVDTFVFYIICEVDAYGARVMGHFSKELGSKNNLACIMVLPPYQRKGYGKLLIQLSYELSYREGWIGTPEKPLSDLGKVSYRSYWWWRILGVMETIKVDSCTVSDLSRLSCIDFDDCIATLQTMNLVKFWRGEHVVSISKHITDHCRFLNFAKPPSIILDSAKLRWVPKVSRDSPRTSMERE